MIKPHCPECGNSALIESGKAFYSMKVLGWDNNVSSTYGLQFGDETTEDYSDVGRLYTCNGCGYDDADVRAFFPERRTGKVTPGAPGDDPGVHV